MNFVNVSKTEATAVGLNAEFVKQELTGILFGCGFKSEIWNCPLLSHHLAPLPPYFSSHCAEIHQISNTVPYIFKNLYLLWTFEV